MTLKNQKIIIDLDNTITINDLSKSYQNKPVNEKVVDTLKNISDKEIVIFTARNMKTHKGDLKKIHKLTKPIAEAWLKKHNISYDEIIFGKPWCKENGHYVDDKNLSLEEFIFKFSGPYSKNTVDIVIPFYNESKNIIYAYHEIKKLDRLFNIKNYIFVDNGSTDNSQKYFDEIKNIDNKIKVVEVKNNIGYGNGMKQGIDNARSDIIITNHADCQFDAYSFFYQNIPELLDSNPLSIFPRRLNRPFMDRLNTKILQIFMSVISFDKVSDFNGQPKLFKKNEVKNILEFPDDFTFDFHLWKSIQKKSVFPIIQKPRFEGQSSWANNFKKRFKIFISYLISSTKK